MISISFFILLLILPCFKPFCHLFGPSSFWSSFWAKFYFFIFLGQVPFCHRFRAKFLFCIFLGQAPFCRLFWPSSILSSFSDKVHFVIFLGQDLQISWECSTSRHACIHETTQIVRFLGYRRSCKGWKESQGTFEMRQIKYTYLIVFCDVSMGHLFHFLLFHNVG